MSIASNLRRAVDENGVSAASLAREIGAEPSTVRKYLSGAARPNDAVLARLSACLDGWTAEELRFGKETSRRGKLTTEEVSRWTGIDPLSLRVGLQRGIWPFGTAYKRPGSTKYTYGLRAVRFHRGLKPLRRGHAMDRGATGTSGGRQ